jgi:hypothetical protein|tara:strand:+ start:420 stop:614 length:195 start_codon:yes stop_codon:yes gene_type:complete
MWKAMALVCMIENGETKCPTELFDTEFESKNECEIWLKRKRFYGMPRNKKIVLDDCYFSSNSSK